MNLHEKKLNYSARKKLHKSDFVFPNGRRYPIPDKAHARNALARVAQHGTPAEKARVRAAVRKKFPKVGDQDEKEKHEAMLDRLIPRPPLHEDCGYDEPDDPGYAGCPQCGGDGVLLGTLGKRKHYRCRQCGWDFSEDEASSGDSSD